MAGILSRLFASPQQLLQYAALPYRRDARGRLEIALITSRGTGRWIVPKGWPEAGRTPEQLVADEAREEAGLEGDVSGMAIGSYTYRKQLHLLASVDVRVDVLPMLVTGELADWQEKPERTRAWYPPAEASRLVREPGLSALLADFRPQATDAT